MKCTLVTTREEIVATADQLFYTDGFEHTSFANIADAVGISRGNFYHHFKSKDLILEAVIQHRLAATRSMLGDWESRSDSPAECVASFLDILLANRVKIKRSGCPVGTLCSELAKLHHPAQAQALEIFSVFRVWLKRQFLLMGCKADADKLALQVLAWSQGVATLYNAFHDEAFLRAEVTEKHAWLRALADTTFRSKS